MSVHRIKFRELCPECESTDGYTYDIVEQFCTDCGALRSGPSRILDLPEITEHTKHVTALETDAMRRARWETEKYEQRRAWQLEQLARLEAVGAVKLDEHPLGHTWCQHSCSDTFWLAAASRTRNGVLLSNVHCGRCGRLTPSHSISHKLLDPSALPILFDNACSSCDGQGCPQCSYRCSHSDCDSFSQIEVHHILPKHIAKANGLYADHWPVVRLCREHHMQWHSLVTPNMTRIEGVA